MEYREAIVSLDMLFDRNPAYGDLYADAIEYCTVQVDEAAAAAYLDGERHGNDQIQSGASVVATLVRRGGLKQTILVDGEPYEGTPQDLQGDENVPEDAVVEYLVESTEAGIQAAAAYRDSHEMAALFDTLPQFVPGFKVVLDQCRDEQGKTTNELQDALIEAGVIAPGLAQAQELHASYFTSKLERYGALVWDRKRWRTTEKGVDALA